MYYIFDRKPQLTGRWIDDGPFIKGIYLNRGQLIQEDLINTPFLYTLKKINPNSEDHGHYLPAYLRDAYPLFRKDLVEALEQCGVDNLQVFDATVFDPETGKNISDYKAVNIVALIAAADMKKSDAKVSHTPPLVDVEFDRLVIDESKPGGALMFRLAEATGTIVVHENIRNCLTEKGFASDIAFFNPAEVAI